MSDGASAPWFVRTVLDLDNPRYLAIWQAHDHAYYDGGTEQDRLRADVRMLTALLDAGMGWRTAEQAYDNVRAWGDVHFHYTDRTVNPVEAP